MTIIRSSFATAPPKSYSRSSRVRNASARIAWNSSGKSYSYACCTDMTRVYDCFVYVSRSREPFFSLHTAFSINRLIVLTKSIESSWTCAHSESHCLGLAAYRVSLRDKCVSLYKLGFTGLSFLSHVSVLSFLFSFVIVIFVARLFEKFQLLS